MSQDTSTTENAEPIARAGYLRGSNQVGVRAHNERLILSLVRKLGTITKAQISRDTGLSAQTASVIIRQLETEGLLQRLEPIRGKVGQPTIPFALSGDGAYFMGLKIGRRSVDLVLVNFLGEVIATHRRVHAYPTPGNVLEFVRNTIPELLEKLPRKSRDRVRGIGVATPFQLWNWIPSDVAPPEEMDAWKTCDIAAELEALTGLPAIVRNDGTAACEAERVFGTNTQPRDFLYLYFGYFIGGGLVLDGRLFTGRSGNAAGVGPMPVVGPDGKMQRLMKVASLSTLESALIERGLDAEQLWQSPSEWNIPDDILDHWIESSGHAIASATLSAATIVELEAVFIDGWMPAETRHRIVETATQALKRIDHTGIDPPQYLEGTIGADSRSLGAAAAALSSQYLVDQNSIFT